MFEWLLIWLNNILLGEWGEHTNTSNSSPSLARMRGAHKYNLRKQGLFKILWYNKIVKLLNNCPVLLHSQSD
jgi:hypothetical protein